MGFKVPFLLLETELTADPWSAAGRDQQMGEYRCRYGAISLSVLVGSSDAVDHGEENYFTYNPPTGGGGAG